MNDRYRQMMQSVAAVGLGLLLVGCGSSAVATVTVMTRQPRHLVYPR